MSYTIGEIEDGLLTTLQTSPMAAYCRTFETLGWEQLAAKKAILTPACFAVFTDGALSDLVGGSQDINPARFVVLVVSRNLRGDRAQRRGGPGPTEVGAYEMLDHVRAALHNSDLGLNLLSCSVRGFSRIELGEQFATMAAYGAAVDIAWRYE